MSRTFAYLRVSTPEQTTDNQLGEIAGAGFAVHPRRVVSETVSGSVAAMERRGFAKLMDRMEEGDVLVVTKLDRLGRNAMDVAVTVKTLATLGVRVHCLALGGVDLTSSTGRLTMGVINAVAEFERDLLVERTQAGLRRAPRRGQTHRAAAQSHHRPALRGRPAPGRGRERLRRGPRHGHLAPNRDARCARRHRRACLSRARRSGNRHDNAAPFGGELEVKASDPSLRIMNSDATAASPVWKRIALRMSPKTPANHAVTACIAQRRIGRGAATLPFMCPSYLVGRHTAPAPPIAAHGDGRATMHEPRRLPASDASRRGA